MSDPKVYDRTTHIEAPVARDFAQELNPEQLAAATGGLVSARGGIANCHAALVETKKVIPGLRTVAFGDQECPQDGGGIVQASLRIVA